MAQFVVELFGVPRQITRSSEVELELGPGPVLGDAVAALAQRFPALLGRVLTDDGTALKVPYMFCINGDLFIQKLDHPLKSGDRLLLMFPPTGG